MTAKPREGWYRLKKDIEKRTGMEVLCRKHRTAGLAEVNLQMANGHIPTTVLHSQSGPK